MEHHTLDLYIYNLQVKLSEWGARRVGILDAVDFSLA
jgi:hypothetical protein